MHSQVIAVHSSSGHHFSKESVSKLELVSGHGVQGDAHFGTTVKHRSRVAKDPTQPNLRQVHLLHAELLDELKASGLNVEPGQMGENITTRGLAILDLSAGTKLKLGETAVLVVTGLRNPCGQIEKFKPGLLAAVLDRDSNGELVRKAGVMCIVETGGIVRPGEQILILGTVEQHVPLKPV